MTTKTKVYEDAWTLDGRLRPTRGTITKGKVKAVRELLNRHLAGNEIATATLKEALTTTDAIFNLAYLTNLNFVPNYEESERNWSTIAGQRTVPDFRPVTLYSINRSWTDGNGESNVLGEHGEAPVIPEGTAYPYAYIAGEVAQGTGVRKRGLKTDWTLESRINDGLAALDNLPSELLEVSLDTDEADVWGALVNQVTAASALDGGEVPGGLQAVAPNSALSADAIARAIIELSERTINGRKIRITGGYNLVVPVGQGLFANFIINSQRIESLETTNGSVARLQPARRGLRGRVGVGRGLRVDAPAEAGLDSSPRAGEALASRLRDPAAVRGQPHRQLRRWRRGQPVRRQLRG
jgi:hypothetical protein